MTTLTFNDVTFNPVPQSDGQIWLTSTEIAKALGYSRTDNISKIFDRNKDEFSSNMTVTVNLGVNGINGSTRQKAVRIFSLRGCHLLAMFAKTEVAKKFRVWVLDILDKEVGQPVITPINDENRLSTTHDRKPLVKAVNMLVDETGAIVSNVWRMVHQQFGVESVEELTKAQVKEAITYIHQLFLINTKSYSQPLATDQELYEILHGAISSHYQLHRMTRNLANTLLVGDQVRSDLAILKQKIQEVARFAERQKLRNLCNHALIENQYLNAWTGAMYPIPV